MRVALWDERTRHIHLRVYRPAHLELTHVTPPCFGASICKLKSFSQRTQ